MALDSILSTAIIPPPPKSAAPAGSPGPLSLTQPASSNDPSNSTGRASSGDDASGGADRSTSHATHDSSASSSNTSSTDKQPARSTDSGTRAHGSSRSKPNTSHAAKQAQDSNAARGTQGGNSARQRQGKASSFVDALAQSQADAAASTDATAAAPASGKTKDANDDPSDTAATPASLAFIPQSVAAAMAAASQPPAQPQSGASASADSAEDDSLAALTAKGKTGAQTVIGALTDGEKDLTAATDAASALKGDAGSSTTPANTALAPDATNAAAAFQAHMSISSQLQAPPTDAGNGNKLNAHVGTAAFNDELGGKITWLASQGVQSASLQLSPEHLGPVNVHISVQDGSASVSFNAAHADTRAALEQALPRLREMFSTQGLMLADANVSHQSPRGHSQRQSSGATSAIGGATNDSNATSITSIATSRLGLVDTYA